MIIPKTFWITKKEREKMTTTIDYSKADQWIIGEKRFDSRYLGKYESILCLGNGYMCIRSATEETYPGETRNFFVAGTFNMR